LECLHKPSQWQGLRCFAVLESERTIGDKTTCEQRLYISSLAPDAHRIAHAVRSQWSIENRLHWCMDVSFNDDQMRARTKAAAHNLAVLRHITLNLIRLDPIKRKGGIKARRLIAATSDSYSRRAARAQMMFMRLPCE
jgi:predicted transposase YbfD/YdcC